MSGTLAARGLTGGENPAPLANKLARVHVHQLTGASGFGKASPLCHSHVRWLVQGKGHPGKAVSQIKLKYLLGGLQAPGKAGVRPRPCPKELRCAIWPAMSMGQRDKIAPMRGDQDRFQSSQGFEAGLKGQLGCLEAEMTAWAAKQKAKPVGCGWRGLAGDMRQGGGQPLPGASTGTLGQMRLQRELRARPSWAPEQGARTFAG